MEITDVLVTKFVLKGAKKAKKQLKKIKKQMKEIMEEGTPLQISVQSPEEVSQAEYREKFWKEYEERLATLKNEQEQNHKVVIEELKRRIIKEKEDQFIEFIRNFARDLAKELDDETRLKVIEASERIKINSFTKFKERLKNE